jgi:hypothetical protein
LLKGILEPPWSTIDEVKVKKRVLEAKN